MNVSDEKRVLKMVKWLEKFKRGLEAKMLQPRQPQPAEKKPGLTPIQMKRKRAEKEEAKQDAADEKASREAKPKKNDDSKE